MKKLLSILLAVVMIMTFTTPAIATAPDYDIQITSTIMVDEAYRDAGEGPYWWHSHGKFDAVVAGKELKGVTLDGLSMAIYEAYGIGISNYNTNYFDQFENPWVVGTTYPVTIEFIYWDEETQTECKLPVINANAMAYETKIASVTVEPINIYEGGKGLKDIFPVITYKDGTVEKLQGGYEKDWEFPTEVGTYHYTIDVWAPSVKNIPVTVNVLPIPTSGKCGENMTWVYDPATKKLTISGTGDMYQIAPDLNTFWEYDYTYEPEFWYCDVQDIIVEEGVTGLPNFAFGWLQQKTLQLPSTLKNIPEYWLTVSTKMESLVIPEGITSLTGWPFGSPGNSFTALKEISLPSTLKEVDMLTLFLGGLSNEDATQTLQTIRYAGTQEQWEAITRVDSESIKAIFGEDYEIFYEYWVVPSKEVMAKKYISYEPKVCTHNWKPATCTAPKTCSVCGATEGKPVVHTYDDGVDGTCNICGIHRETTENRTVMHMFRMYDPNSGEHFYTGSEVERENLVAAGWNYEGVGFTFSRTTGAPVYRLYDRNNTFEHLYTMDEAEKNKLIAQGWELEGIAFNSAYDTEVPQYRLHNPNETRGAYHFTASEEERDMLIAAGWEYEGIGFYSSWK